MARFAHVFEQKRVVRCFGSTANSLPQVGQTFGGGAGWWFAQNLRDTARLMQRFVQYFCRA